MRQHLSLSVACSSAASPNPATLNLAPWYLAAIACGNSPKRQGLSPKPHQLLSWAAKLRGTSRCACAWKQCRSVCVHAREGASVSGCCRSPPNSTGEGCDAMASPSVRQRQSQRDGYAIPKAAVFGYAHGGPTRERCSAMEGGVLQIVSWKP